MYDDGLLLLVVFRSDTLCKPDIRNITGQFLTKIMLIIIQIYIYLYGRLYVYRL